MDERRMNLLSCTPVSRPAGWWLALIVLVPLIGGSALAIEPAAIEPVAMPTYSEVSAMRSDSTLRAVAFADDQLGVAVGDRGTIVRSLDGGQSWELVKSPTDCILDDVVWLNHRHAVAVGGAYDPITQISRGVVLKSYDGGATWQRNLSHSCPRLRRVERAGRGHLIAHGDWSDIHLTASFDSTDGGRSWSPSGLTKQKHPSGIRRRKTDTSLALRQLQSASQIHAAIRGVCPVGSSRICAVGDHGVIMTSDDDGQSWQVHRGQDRHSKILVIGPSANSIPWSLVASETLQWRHRVSILLQPSPPARMLPPDQEREFNLARQVAIQMGASGIDTIDPHQPPAAELERWIRIFSPSVVVIDQSLPTESLNAVYEAGKRLGVSRIFQSSASNGDSGASYRSISMHRNALLPQVGMIAADFTSDACHLLDPLGLPGRLGCKQTIGLKQIYSADAVSVDSGQSIATGLRTRGGQLQAKRPPATRHRLQTLQARLRQNSLLLQKIGSAHDHDEALQWIELTIRQTAAEDQRRLAWGLYTQLRGTPRATAALTAIANRFSGQSLARWAQWTLKRQQESAEEQPIQQQVRGAIRSTAQKASGANTVVVSPFQTTGESPFGLVRQTSASIPIGVGPNGAIRPPLNPTSSAPKAKEPLGDESPIDLAFEFHPAVLVGMARDQPASESSQNSSPTDGGKEWTADLMRVIQSGLPSWSGLLAGNSHQSVAARKVQSVPRLDGLLDDACWQPSKRSSQRSIHTQVSYNDDYVFLSVVCPNDRFNPSSPDDESTGRDQPLDNSDRLSLRIDTDRDLWTWYRLEVTAEGRTRDEVDGNLDWQPTWYVDALRDDQEITFEIALRRSDLQQTPIRSGDAWYISAEIVDGNTPSTTPLLPDAHQWKQVIFE